MWRKDGFFVPALPPEATGHAERELYGLGDVVAVRVMRLLLEAGVDREVVARVGEELPAWDGGEFWQFRQFATVEPALWHLVLTVAEWAAERDEVGSYWTDDKLTERCATDPDVRRDDDLVWFCPEGQRVAVWFPLSMIAAEMAEKADQWRRQRRIAEKDWPPWM